MPRQFKHTRGGNCWAGVRYGDVCTKHDAPRGECPDCPECLACQSNMDLLDYVQTSYHRDKKGWPRPTEEEITLLSVSNRIRKLAERMETFDLKISLLQFASDIEEKGVMTRWPRNWRESVPWLYNS